MSIRVHLRGFWLHEGVAVLVVSFFVFRSVVAFVVGRPHELSFPGPLLPFSQVYCLQASGFRSGVFGHSVGPGLFSLAFSVSRALS